MTYAVNASRDLSLNFPVGNGVIAALATSAGLAIIGAAFAIKGFRRPM
jgi:ABC-2 type transport system permease protein